MENSVQIVDMLGNPLQIGDIVLVLIPKTDASFRKAIIRNMESDEYFPSYRKVYVEYDDGRLYSDVKHFYIKKDTPVKFRSKPIKVWRYASDVIKFDQKYFD